MNTQKKCFTTLCFTCAVMRNVLFINFKFFYRARITLCRLLSVHEPALIRQNSRKKIISLNIFPMARFLFLIHICK